MPGSSKDHTQLLLPYQKILEASEEEYRGTSAARQDTVISSIIEQIGEAATAAGARVTDKGNLYKVRIMVPFCWHRC